MTTDDRVTGALDALKAAFQSLEAANTLLNGAPPLDAIFSDSRVGAAGSDVEVAIKAVRDATDSLARALGGEPLSDAITRGCLILPIEGAWTDEAVRRFCDMWETAMQRWSGAIIVEDGPITPDEVARRGWVEGAPSHSS